MPVQLWHWYKRPIEFLLENRDRYGDLFTMRLPGRRGMLDSAAVVVASSPETIKDVFTGPASVLHAGKAAVVLRPLVGDNSLLLLDGAEHLRQRRLMLPPFHGERMREYLEVMREETENQFRTIPVGSAFTLHDHTQAITLRIILRTVFGIDEMEMLRDLGQELARTMEIATNPSSLLLNMLPISVGAKREFDRQLAITDEMLFREIARRRAAGDAADRSDVLSMLLLATDEDGAPMTDQELRDELVTLLAAGHETTATSLAWTVRLLALHPEAMQKAVRELDLVAGTDPLDDRALSELVYLDAAIKEALRLKPVIPMVGRVLQVPMQVHGFTLPAGCALAPSIFLTHRNPAIYQRPDEFEPERFVGVKPNPYAWLPFGGGIRRCLGMAFALYEMKIVLATLLQQFELSLEPGSQDEMARRGITFAPHDGTRVIATPRVRGPSQAVA